MCRKLLLSVSFALLAFIWSNFAALRAADPGDTKVEFSRDIRGILSDKCFKCHGPAEHTREAGLRLDLEAGAFAELESGNVAIVPGKPDASELIRRLTSSDADERMPPADSGKEVTPGEIALIKRWIEQGAQWQGHWSFIAPKRPPLPEVKQSAWPKNPIDDFVLARLEASGLAPSGPADRRTLIRRVTFDLTGLPPTPEEVEAFVKDTAPDAYERVVHRLLKSPHFGEHIGRYWLDVARYGDTHGLHLDNYREMWPYRDWVIQALNDNMPFDQFTIEQLAGDLLPGATLSQQIASGFNRCNVTTSEGGSIAEEVYVRNVIDRVETASTVFMGLTMGCAVCHDHKFDPLTMKEFYQLFAFFNSLDGNPLDGNKKDPAPVVRVPLPEVQQEFKQIEQQLASIAAQQARRAQEIEADFGTWLAKASAKTDRAQLPGGMLAHFPLDEAQGGEAGDAVDPNRRAMILGRAIWTEGKSGGALKFDGNNRAVLGELAGFERDQPFSYGAWIKTTGKVIGAPLARMDDRNGFRGYDLYLVGRKVSMHLIHHWSDNALKVTTKHDVLSPRTWHHVMVTYDGSSRASGVVIYVDGKPHEFEVNNDSLSGTTVAETPLQLGGRDPGSAFIGGEVDDVRIYDRRLGAVEVAVLAGSDPIGPLLAIAPEQRTEQQQQALRQYYLNTLDPTYQKLALQKSQLESRRTSLSTKTATTLVFKELAAPKPAYVLKRGQYDQHGEQVERNTPAALPPMADLPRNRLGLARWLTSPDHPLMARVTVNRFWQQCFGTGLVITSEDFGSQGEVPSHPQLLDWLAVEFRESGWDVKRLMKMIVTSATYRQDSRVTRKAAALDPRNRLLSRGPRFRLDAEALRDQALSISGLLIPTMGGPSVKPPQPQGIWYAVGYTKSNTARFTPDEGSKIFRRSVYTFWKRTAPPPSMNTFDAPSRESCRVRRERTNTPLQALLMMNERQYFEAARHLAQRAMQQGGTSPPERADYMFRRAACRPPDVEELATLVTSYQAQLAEYQQDAEAAQATIKVGDTPPDAALDASELAAWTMVANLILNLDEVVNKN